jgi:hypothetical protein
MTEPIQEPVLEEGLPADEETAELEGGFSRRALGWIVASVVISFIAFVLLANFGEDLDQRPNPDANTFSHSALGHRALVSLLRSAGLGVVSRQAPAGGGVGPRHPLVLAEPDLGRDPQRLATLLQEAQANGAPLVVVLPKWSAGEPQKKKPEWLSTVSLRPLRQVARVVALLGDPKLPEVNPQRFSRARRCGWIGEAGAPPQALRIDTKPAQLLEPSPDLEPLIVCSEGLLAARRPKTSKGPQIVLIADPDVLNNHGLGRGENAAAVYRLFVEGLDVTGVVFDETIHGFNRTPGLLAEALRFPMVLGVLQGLLLLGVVLWAGMSRFGKPLPASTGDVAGKEVLIGNTAELLARGGHAGDSLGRYFHQTTRAVAAHYFLPADLPEGERLARLQRLAGGRGGKLNLAVLEREINMLPDGRRAEAQAARIARQLYQWRVEMTNGN